MISAVFEWLGAGVVYGTLFLAFAWALAVTVLRKAHPSVRAVLFSLALLKFGIPFGPVLPGLSAPSVVPRAAESVRLDTGRQGSASAAGPFPWQELVVFAWAIGVTVSAAMKVRRHARVRRAMAAQPPAGEALTARVQAMAKRLGAPVPHLREGGVTACVTGVLRPVLVVPRELEGAALDAVLVHELTHLRRRDPLLGMFESALATLFFFWPPARLAARWLSLAREQACDLAVLKAQVIAPERYAELLLEAGLATGGALSIAPKASQLERRIEMVLTEQSWRPKWWAIAVAGLVGLACGATRTSLTPPSREPPPLVLPEVGSFEDNLIRDLTGVQPPVSPRIAGPLDARSIQSVIDAHEADFRACYMVHKAMNPEMGGRISLHWSIRTDGTVGDVCMTEAAEADQGYGKCLSAHIATWTFPAPVNGPVDVEYPFQTEGC